MHLFLYGTLRPEADTPMARWLARRSRGAQPAVARGRLLAIRSAQGWYPALDHGAAGGTCRGTLVRAVLRPNDLALLDRYEGSAYRRTRAWVRTAGDALVFAWLYRWQVDRPANAEPIRGGDFLVSLERGARRSFAPRSQAR